MWANFIAFFVGIALVVATTHLKYVEGVLSYAFWIYWIGFLIFVVFQNLIDHTFRYKLDQLYYLFYTAEVMVCVIDGKLLKL